MIDWEVVEVQIGLPTYNTMAGETESIIANRKFKDESKI